MSDPCKRCEEAKCSGFSNYATFNVATYLDNDPKLLATLRNLLPLADHPGQVLRAWMMEKMEAAYGGLPMRRQELLGMTVYAWEIAVDWEEAAAYLLRPR
jgi:hypothetical protein